MSKILSITCDNATNNDMMVDDLTDRLLEYPNEEHRTQCFAHVVNLVVKSLLNQFEPPKKSKDNAIDATERDLLVLADGWSTRISIPGSQRQKGERASRGMMLRGSLMR